MRKVALHGSYFGYNFGDTLLCALFRHWINSVSDVEVVVPLASRRNRQLIGADRRGLFAFIRCTDVIFCGGGYFGGPGQPSLKWSVRNYFRHFLIAELAMLTRKRISILGTGVGPVTSPFLRRELRRLVNHADQIIVRDEESRNFLQQELGVSRSIIVDVDAAMYMPREFFDKTPEVKESETTSQVPDPQVVAIHLTNFGAPQWEAMAEVIAEFCARESSIVPLLIVDSRTRSGQPAAQDKASQRLHVLIPRAKQIGYNGDPTELCRVLDSTDLIVTNKLHVGIVGVVLGKNIISLPQHVKTPRFYKQLGLSSICIVENQPEGLRDLLELWRKGDYPTVRIPSRNNVYRDALKNQLSGGNG